MSPTVDSPPVQGQDSAEPALNPSVAPRTAPGDPRRPTRLVALFEWGAFSLGGALLLIGSIVLATGKGVAVRVGPLVVSAKDPIRLMMEGALLCLLGLVLCRWAPSAVTNGRRIATLAFLAIYYLALAGESTPRRVGDGHEYLAMAFQLAHGHPPAMNAADAEAFDVAQRGSAVERAVDLRSVADFGTSRTDFIHFWAYSALAAPFLRIAIALGIGWNWAFFVLNAGLLCALYYVSARSVLPPVALSIAAGPIVWWIDKAHTEVFTFAVLGLCILLIRTHVHLSLLLAGLLTAQNPAFAAVLAAVAVPAIVRSHARRRTFFFCALAVAIAAVHPAYYWVRTGAPVPLAAAAAWHVPTVRAILTPFLDPLLGLLWYSPWIVLLLLLVPGPAAQSVPRAYRLGLVSAAAALLVLFSLTGNANHGGTPGPSRYALWVLPFSLVGLVDRAIPVGARRVAVLGVVLASMIHSAWAFHPRLEEYRWITPQPGTWVLENLPSIYNPLPEVFAERVGQFDGFARLPVTTHGCQKLLLLGEGRASVRWPLPCVPQATPAFCATDGALCYANRRRDGSYEFSRAPTQPSFFGTLAEETTWASVSDVDPLPVKVEWSALEVVPPRSSGSRIRDARHVTRIYAYQSADQLYAVVLPLDSSRPEVRLVGVPGCAWWVPLASEAAAGGTEPLEISASQWLIAPTAGPLRLITSRDCGRP